MSTLADAVDQALYEGDAVAYIGAIRGNRGEAELRIISVVGDEYLKLDGNNRKVMPWNVIKIRQTI